MINKEDIIVKKKQQKLEVTFTATAVFGLEDLAEIEAWKESIQEYGEIINTNIEVVIE